MSAEAPVYLWKNLQKQAAQAEQTKGARKSRARMKLWNGWGKPTIASIYPAKAISSTMLTSCRHGISEKTCPVQCGDGWG